MSSVATRFVKFMRVSVPSSPTSSLAVGVQRSSRLWFSSTPSDSDIGNDDTKNNAAEDDFDDFIGAKKDVNLQRSSRLWFSSTPSDSDIGNDDTKNNVAEDDFGDFIGTKKDVNLQPQGVDPRRGWGFRGVHKAIICGKVGQAPVQKILRNGRTVTIFTVGTGGMFDQRVMGAKDLPRPAQWHRIVVHNEALGAYAVKQLVKNASIYVEGDIETRVYNDSINGEVKHIPEICIRHDGKLRLIKTGESISSISLDDLREDLL